MRALIYDGYRDPLHVADVADPVAPVDGVVLRVEAAGLCRSDWHSWNGHDEDIPAFPHVPGHEFAGTIVEVGPEVTRWRVGDRVTTPFVCACGRCLVCESGNHQVCPNQWQPGFDGWGGFAEYVALPSADTNLVRLPHDMEMTTAAGLGCRVATAYRAIAQVGRAAPGEEVVVHGCGGVGLAAVMIARALGARVTAVDPSAQARDLALRFGAAAAIGPSESDSTLAEIVAVTAGGPHLSLEALGRADVCRLSIQSLRPRGRHVQVGLLSPATTSDPVPMHRVIARELEVLGSHGMAAKDYSDLLALVSSGRIRPDLLVTRTIGFDEVPAAFAEFGSADQHPGVTVLVP